MLLQLVQLVSLSIVLNCPLYKKSRSYIPCDFNLASGSVGLQVIKYIKLDAGGKIKISCYSAVAVEVYHNTTFRHRTMGHQLGLSS